MSRTTRTHRGLKAHTCDRTHAARTPAAQMSGYCSSTLVDSVTGHTLCVCASGWDGASDFFDSRVAINDSDHVAVAFMCSNSPLSITILYAVALAAVVYTVYINARVLVLELRRPSARLDVRSNMALRVALLELVVAAPMFFVSISFKLRPNPPVYGTDPLITLTFYAASVTWCATLADYYYVEFVAFASVHASSVSRRLIGHFKVISTANVVIYFSCTVVPMIAMLFTDKRVGVYQSGAHSRVLAVQTLTRCIQQPQERWICCSCGTWVSSCGCSPCSSALSTFLASCVGGAPPCRESRRRWSACSSTWSRRKTARAHPASSCSCSTSLPGLSILCGQRCAHSRAAQRSARVAIPSSTPRRLHAHQCIRAARTLSAQH